jgi:mono/diheme cytochrome c family protein
MKSPLLCAVLAIVAWRALFAQAPTTTSARRTPVSPLTPAEELKHFVLQPGYRMELALSDPDIQDPVAIAFDGDGRMFVLEQRGYMQDADATAELAPVGRISLHADTRHDGVYDKHSVFVDHLSFPRFVTPFGPNAILTKESNADEVWKYTDTNGDGVADKKELFDTGYGRAGNVEHQEAFLTWTMDNWMYSTYNAFRARWTPQGVLKETTGPNGGTWGVTQDNDGKQWFQGSSSGLPSYWQFPIVYGNFGGGRESPTMDPGLVVPWGAPLHVADMQGGLAVMRAADGTLASTTAGAGAAIFRGDRLPKDLVGDYFYGEEVARIIRRVHVEKHDGLTFIRNAYAKDEFIKATDPIFRPVDQASAPDGTLYVVDMYHGIIQESEWTGRGSYLRARIEQYGLDKVVHRGRIWRVVYDGVKSDRSDRLARDAAPPHMSSETAAELVTHLAHPNGWWRDTAQQWLVLRQDHSVVPALQAMASGSTNLLARFHAMWTLEGLGALDAALVRRLMDDPEPRMRVQAIRASETLYKAGDKSFAADYKRLSKDPSVDVVIQSMLTMNRWKVPDAAATIAATAASNPSRGVQTVANTVSAAAAAAAASRRSPFTADERAAIERGGQIYQELCFACHGADGFGTPRPETNTTMGPPLAGSPRVAGHRDYVVNVLLHGLTGSIDGRTYTDVMVPMGSNSDDWIAAVASYVRTTFDNAGLVTVADVARVRAASAARASPWTSDELVSTLPVPLVTDGWKLSASQNTATASDALALTSWMSGVPQQAAMWLQVELPAPARVTEIQFESIGPAASFPRRYGVEVSADGSSWRAVAEMTSPGSSTAISFAPVDAKFFRLTQTGMRTGTSWSVRNLKLLGRRAAAK